MARSAVGVAPRAAPRVAVPPCNATAFLALRTKIECLDRGFFKNGSHNPKRLQRPECWYLSLANNSRILIEKPSVDYIRTQLDTGRSAQTKRALQYLCKLYRNGHRIRPEELCGVEQ